MATKTELALSMYDAAEYEHSKHEWKDKPYLYMVGLGILELAMALARERCEDPEFMLGVAALRDVARMAGEKPDGETVGTISAEWGARVADAVSALTPNPFLEKSERLADQLKRVKRQGKEVCMVFLAARAAELDCTYEVYDSEAGAFDQEAKMLEEFLTESEYVLRELGEASPALARRINEQIKTRRWELWHRRRKEIREGRKENES